jgi:hypothetical protein
MYIDILHRLRDAVRRKHPEKWRTNSLLLLDNNDPANRSVLVKDFLANNSAITLEHLQYSPGLTQADFYLFLTEINTEAFVMLPTSLRMRRKS